MNSIYFEPFIFHQQLSAIQHVKSDSALNKTLDYFTQSYTQFLRTW